MFTFSVSVVFFLKGFQVFLNKPIFNLFLKHSKTIKKWYSVQLLFYVICTIKYHKKKKELVTCNLHHRKRVNSSWVSRYIFNYFLLNKS